MEKIIGGKEFNNPFPVGISDKILWPCYEFIALAEGIDDNEKNILDEFILRLADINVTDRNEIASCLGLEDDLISFMQSRMQQNEYIDQYFNITETGKKKLGEFAETQPVEIHVYVDAVSGRIIPYYNPLNTDNRFKYSFGDDSGQEYLKYKGFSTAGTEIDKEQKAYKLHYDENNNTVPEGEDVTAMLHKLHPGHDGVFAQIDKKQPAKKNLCWILLDIIQPEGASRDWIFTDGFGNISSFFSSRHIKNEIDNKYISELRSKKEILSNASDNSKSPQRDQKYPQLHEKITQTQKCLKELEIFVDSPDKEEALRSAVSDSLLFLTQLAEWVLFYILHKDGAEYKSKKVLSDLEGLKLNKNSNFIIGKMAKRKAAGLGFLIEKDFFFFQSYGRLCNAFNGNPALFPLTDILLIGFENEPWLHKLASGHPDFLSVLTELNKNRNQSFHSGGLDKIKALKKCIDKAYTQIMFLIDNVLENEVTESSALTFTEKIAIMNEFNNAITRTEQTLGFALYQTLNFNLTRFVTDMERRGTEADSLNNAIIIDQYKILEHLFVSVTECLGDEHRNEDWKAKSQECGFELDLSERGKKEFGHLLGTKPERINAALNRKPSSMNAACIAFCTLADNELLHGIAKQWPEMLSDVSYIANKRGHGEIPAKIDSERALKMKEDIIDLIHFFAENGFLTRKNVN